MPLALVGVLIVFFLLLEARRYRYFNVWRARARWIETHFYAPMLADGDLHLEENWQKTLANDYLHPKYHVGYLMSVGRRLRRNYLWIVLIQTLAFFGKITVHPTPVKDLDELLQRASIGPLPGWLLVVVGFTFIVAWIVLATWSSRSDARRAKHRQTDSSMG